MDRLSAWFVHFRWRIVRAITPSRGPRLLSSHLNGLAARSEGGLWITYSDGGASFVNRGVVANYAGEPGVRKTVFYAVTEDAYGTMWGGNESWAQKVQRSLLGGCRGAYYQCQKFVPGSEWAALGSVRPRNPILVPRRQKTPFIWCPLSQLHRKANRNVGRDVVGPLV